MRKIITDVVEKFNDWGSQYDISATVRTLGEAHLNEGELTQDLRDCVHGSDGCRRLPEDILETFRNMYVLDVEYGSEKKFFRNSIYSMYPGDHIIFTDVYTPKGKNLIVFQDKYAGIRYELRTDVSPYDKEIDLDNLMEMLLWIDKYAPVNSGAGELAIEVEEHGMKLLEQSPFNIGVHGESKPGLSIYFAPEYLNEYTGDVLDEDIHCKLDCLISADTKETILKTRVWDVRFLDSSVEFPRRG